MLALFGAAGPALAQPTLCGHDAGPGTGRTLIHFADPEQPFSLCSACHQTTTRILDRYRAGDAGDDELRTVLGTMYSPEQVEATVAQLQAEEVTTP